MRDFNELCLTTMVDKITTVAALFLIGALMYNAFKEMRAMNKEEKDNGKR